MNYKITESELKDIGEIILREINIPLFNARPTNQKVFQLYHELVYAGYEEEDKVLACNKIKLFFEKRTFKNQAKLFFQFFGLSLDDNLRAHFTLSFKSSEVDFENIKSVATRVHLALSRINEVQNYEIDVKVLSSALMELYRPKYFENEWRVNISSLSLKIQKILQQKKKDSFISEVGELFLAIDPKGRKKKKIQGISQIDKINDDIGETILTRKNVIRDTEIEFVKFTLELINGDEVPEFLIEDLYQSNERHPLVRMFLNCVKKYNLLMINKELPTIEVLKELKVVVRGIRQIGEEIVRSYEEVVISKEENLKSEILYV